MGATVIKGSGSGSGGIGAGALSIVAAAQPASVNLSTEGTIDWFATPAYTNPPRAASTDAGGVNTKISSGLMLLTFDWCYAGVDASGDSPATGLTLQSTSSDDVASQALNTTNKARINFSGVVGSGWGFRYRFNVDTTNRVNRLYFGHYACDALVRVSLSDGSAADSTLALTNGAGVNADRMVTINAQAGSACICTVSVLTTTTYTGPSMYFGGTALAYS